MKTTTFTNTSARKDISMNGTAQIVYNDYNVLQRGSNYDSIQYAIVPTADTTMVILPL